MPSSDQTQPHHEVLVQDFQRSSCRCEIKCKHTMRCSDRLSSHDHAFGRLNASQPHVVRTGPRVIIVTSCSQTMAHQIGGQRGLRVVIMGRSEKAKCITMVFVPPFWQSIPSSRMPCMLQDVFLVKRNGKRCHC